MKNTVSTISLDDQLKSFADELDISTSDFEKAEKRYEAIGEWLARDESIIAEYSPRIFPQGSFAIGTVIKPETNAEEYDVDLVCELQLSRDSFSQQKLKEMVGEEIKKYAEAQNMDNEPEEGSRCWTLQYANGAQFHMDILPAIPYGTEYQRVLDSKGLSNEWADTMLAITDTNHRHFEQITTEWLRSNREGFAEWFKEQMKVQLYEQKVAVANARDTDIDEIPDYEVKTPLQRSVQILKRHRDLMYPGDPEEKPISMVITTLVAHAYGGESQVSDALPNIVRTMPEYIQNENGKTKIINPTDPLENFADDWVENPEKEEAFQEWMREAQAEFSISDSRILTENINSLETPSTNRYRIDVKDEFNEPQRDPLPEDWEITLDKNVSIQGYVKNKNGNGAEKFSSNSAPLEKERDLVFQAETNVPEKFDVYWQVVNTGEEASDKESLRGDVFKETAGEGGLQRNESTLYTGQHWIECFVVDKNNRCRARSGEYVVNIQ